MISKMCVEWFMMFWVQSRIEIEDFGIMHFDHITVVGERWRLVEVLYRLLLLRGSYEDTSATCMNFI